MNFMAEFEKQVISKIEKITQGIESIKARASYVETAKAFETTNSSYQEIGKRVVEIGIPQRGLQYTQYNPKFL